MDEITVQIIRDQPINVLIIEKDPIICNIQGNVGSEGIVSVPPLGKLKVKNLYVDPDTGKLKVDYDDGR